MKENKFYLNKQGHLALFAFKGFYIFVLPTKNVSHATLYKLGHLCPDCPCIDGRLLHGHLPVVLP